MKLIQIATLSLFVISGIAISLQVNASQRQPSDLNVATIAQRTCAVVNDPEPPLNVRSRPGTNFRILVQLNNGSQVAIVEEQDGWYRVVINPPNGTGWVAGNRVIVTSCN